MEVCLSQEEVRTRIGGGESEVGEPESEVGKPVPGSAGKPGCERLQARSTYRLGAPESPESGHGAAPRRSRALPEETKR